MILYEFEGKDLLKTAGIAVPNSQVITRAEFEANADITTIKAPCVLKAQVLSGKRASAGGIVVVEDQENLQAELRKLFGKVVNKEVVETVLIEEKVEAKSEMYFSLSYDTNSRMPYIALVLQGGTGVEDQHENIGIEVNILDPMGGLPTDIEQYISREFLEKAFKLFFDTDCTLLEINPLIKNSKGEYMALDAKIKLDDTAAGRHEEWQSYPSRGVPGYSPTEREIAAKKIDEGDHRGTAGSTYFDIDGDIAVMASGGGGSLTALDTLLKLGGRPANYTEYSGNPPKEKVEKLTAVVLSKPNLHGLWVVGAIANLTDIYETLSGFIEGLRHVRDNLGIKIDFPIVIRRAGPRDDEAFAMLREVRDFDLHLFSTETSITQSAKIMSDLAKEYSKNNV
jgi:succinyl-CoA synthetase beta subunit